MVFKVIATLILLLVCFMFAPFMTIGVIFLLADWGPISMALFMVFLILGIINFFRKINE